jgi:GH43 family beta-xylosidase
MKITPHMKWIQFGLITLLAASVKLFADDTFENPVVTNQTHPDPFVFKHDDGWYYGLSTHEGALDIVIFRSKDLVGLYRGERRAIWKSTGADWNKKDVWAPELHLIRGTFYVYYSAGDGTKQSCGVLKCLGNDPFNGQWEECGRLRSPEADDWSIDGTVLQQNGKLYFIWSCETPDNMKMQKLLISEMADPTTLVGPRAEISRPSFAHERRGNPKVIEDVNEGPQVLQHAGKTFLIYSCSFCGTRHYNLGMLMCAETADPMIPANWSKSSVSVFLEGNGLYGTGHCSFTKSPDGTEDWLVYHAMLNDKKTNRGMSACSHSPGSQTALRSLESRVKRVSPHRGNEELRGVARCAVDAVLYAHHFPPPTAGGQSSVRKGEAGKPAALYRLPSGQSFHE